MPRSYIAAAALVVVAVGCWFVPLVRVVPLSDAQPSQQQFEAKQVAEHLWETKLAASFSRATDAAAAIEALRRDPEAARRQFGIGQGVSRSILLYLHASGTIVSADKQGVALSLGDNDTPDVVLQKGMIFGNAVRDATGLIASGDVETSQQFNEMSNELNRLVEERVVPHLESLSQVGKRLEFVGCAIVKDPARVKVPLEVVPVSISEL